jgi:hypothetical protein
VAGLRGPLAVIGFTIAGERIVAIDLAASPDKLRRVPSDPGRW